MVYTIDMDCSHNPLFGQRGLSFLLASCFCRVFWSGHSPRTTPNTGAENFRLSRSGSHNRIPPAMFSSTLLLAWQRNKTGKKPLFANDLRVLMEMRKGFSTLRLLNRRRVNPSAYRFEFHDGGTKRKDRHRSPTEVGERKFVIDPKVFVD